MKHVDYTPTGVCSRKINFDLAENGTIHNLTFIGGCQGNLAAIGKLVEGKNSEQIAQLLLGNTCGPRPTSCTDQLAQAILVAIKAKQAG